MIQFLSLLGKAKPTTIAIVLLSVTVGIGYLHYSDKVETLELSVQLLETEKLLLESTVKSQNTAIENLKPSEDMEEKIILAIKGLDKDTKSTIHSIEKALEVDSSNENKLVIIETLLKDFSNE